MSMTQHRKLEIQAAAIYAQGVNPNPQVDTRTKEEIFGNRTVRVETVRRPYNRRDWQSGRTPRMSFSGGYDAKGRYFDID